MGKRGLALLGALFVAAAALVAPVSRAAGDSPRFVVSYAASVPANARPAIQAGVDLWASLVTSAVPITVDVSWEALPMYVAASSEPLEFATDPNTGFQVPIALANARAGTDLDPSKTDIHLTFSSRERWQLDPNSPAPAGVVDLMSFTLHEVGHGLGFYSASHKDGNGLIVYGNMNGEGAPGPTLLDSMLMTTAGTMLVDPNPVANAVRSIRASISNNDVVWSGSARDSKGRPPHMSSGAFEPHTSLMHLDENTYPKGDPDALMTTMIRRGETVRSVGPAAIGILRDMGWPMAPTPAAAAPAPAPTIAPTPGASAPAPVGTTPTTVVLATSDGGANAATGSRQLKEALASAPQNRTGNGPSGAPTFLLVGVIIAGAVAYAVRRLRATPIS